MAKQVLEIEVPDGKKALWKDGRVVFEDIGNMENIKNIDDAIRFLVKNEIGDDILNTLSKLLPNSFEWKVAAYRAVVAAVTYNEQRHLTTGDKWYPVVEFCYPKDKKNCWGEVLIGTIESEGERYSVVGGNVSYGSNVGLGHFDSRHGVSYSPASVGFRSVSSKEIAQHISTYFGKLLFDVCYGGTNCDWKWVELNQ